MSLSLLALGANLPFAGRSAEANLRLVMKELESLEKCRVLASSRLWRSAPVMAEGPLFFNACSLMDTSLEPLELLKELLSLESHWGRIRGSKTGQALAAARTLDLDLIWMEGRTSDGARLSLPHPRASGRAFVLGPLLDLEPWLGERLQLPHPATGEPCSSQALWLQLPEVARLECQPMAEPIDPMEKAA
ncbi:MAG: 2-amino-4-hydroxy-6-hydroxymethyldihydropteridine diphosphokinase [Burkholderiaceae bacterium]